MTPFHILLMMFWLETKHLVADYFLQTEYHLGKFAKTGWQIPLAHHCMIHAAGSLLILLCFCPHLWWLCFLDFTCHFYMDRVKASPDLLGRWQPMTKAQYMFTLASRKWKTTNPALLKIKRQNEDRMRENKYFWYALGVDQYVHQLTSLWIVALCVAFAK